MLDRRSIVSVSLLLAIAASARAEDRQWRPDELITMRIEIALYSAPEIDPQSIAVVSKDGRVHLTGVVPSADVKARLEQMVRQADGVKGLDSALTVDAASRVQTPTSIARDDTLKADVTARLNKESDLSDSEIQVQSARNGTVVLGGFAKSLDDQLQALRLAKNVPGVAFVQNDMKSPPDTAHDLDLPGGLTQGGDAQHRREQQALDGRSSETPPMIPGAPTPPRTEEPAGATSGRM